MMADDIVETKIFMMEITSPAGSFWHIILEYEDGSRQISDQSYATQAECEAAIEQYTKEVDGKMNRAH
jgi:hypothetical protein